MSDDIIRVLRKDALCTYKMKKNAFQSRVVNLEAGERRRGMR